MILVKSTEDKIIVDRAGKVEDLLAELACATNSIVNDISEHTGIC